LDFLGEAGRGTALGLLRPEGKPLSIPANYAASYALLRVLSVLRGKLPSAAQRKTGPPPGLPHFQRPKMGEELNSLITISRVQHSASQQITLHLMHFSVFSEGSVVNCLQQHRQEQPPSRPPTPM